MLEFRRAFTGGRLHAFLLVRGRISWISPLAKALLKAREGDVVKLHTPKGVEDLEIFEIRYEAL